jgi:hypothetical protein
VVSLRTDCQHLRAVLVQLQADINHAAAEAEKDGDTSTSTALDNAASGLSAASWIVDEVGITVDSHTTPDRP